jgi:hypothetical protein
MRNSDFTITELVAAARDARDRELGPEAVPFFKLSDVKRRQRRARPFMLLLLAAWIATQFLVIALVRPLMVTRSNWYGLLIILYELASLVLMLIGLFRIQRWVGLRCPHCGATFLHSTLKREGIDPAEAAERDRRCSRCQSIIIDLAS